MIKKKHQKQVYNESKKNTPILYIGKFDREIGIRHTT